MQAIRDAESDEDMFVAPVELSRSTLRRLIAFANLTGQKPLAAASRLLDELLADGDLFEAAEDPGGLQPQGDEDHGRRLN